MGAVTTTWIHTDGFASPLCAKRRTRYDTIDVLLHFSRRSNSAQFTDITMAKKSKKKATRPLSNAPAEKNISVSKQAVGGVTGAVLGAMVGGPVGAIAGGVAGAVVGEQSARGKRPVARTAETIGEEIRKGTPMKALKSVASATTSLGRSRKSRLNRRRHRKRSLLPARRPRRSQKRNPPRSPRIQRNARRRREQRSDSVVESLCFI